MGSRDTEFRHNRDRMVGGQIAGRAITDKAVLAAMREVPREAFVSEAMTEFAYEDTPLPIEAGQTISQPFIVALMLELAEIGPGSRVLEVGAGSGYAAACMSRIAKEVFALERQVVLARLAQQRLKALGYQNVTVLHRDGSDGLPDEAPFDAIIVSAGGREIPPALREQLAIGGRLIIPVGDGDRQILKRVVRTGEDHFVEENLGGVRFVPLLAGVENGDGPKEIDAGRVEGAHSAMRVPFGNKPREPARKRSRETVGDMIARAATPFADYEQLSVLIDRYADCRIVLLGEATHGTSEFYEARAWISERLVALHGFTVVAVEADWPDARVYDAYVRKRPAPQSTAAPFTRFPRWMWRNKEVYALLERLKSANEQRGAGDRAGFYGLDVYSLDTSIAAVLGYLDRKDPEAARIARERYGCLAPWRADPARYGRMAMNAGFRHCEKDVVAVLGQLFEERLRQLNHDGEAFFDAVQNAHIVREAERYYREMYHGYASSWNLRDRHMFDTLVAIMKHRGPQTKAVVWAHNSHIGDATFTEMGRVRGELNLGQLCRERYGAEAALIGFGTDRGTVAAASDWGGDMEIKSVRPARPGSFEGHCRESNVGRFFLDLGLDLEKGLRAELVRPMLERAIGVIYRPETELESHYFEAEPAQQFDAWVWIAETTAVAASHAGGHGGEDETFPFGV